MTPIYFQHDIEQCLETLHKGETILYPTDTVWGIGCDATNPAAVEKIAAIKKRNDHKSMIVLVADEREILRYVTQPDLRVFDFIKGIGKPVTVIYEGAVGLADNLLHPDGSIAIRIVEEEFCKHLIKRFRKPIVSTSANLAGYPPPSIFNDIDFAIRDSVDYVVQYRQDDLYPSQPSAIIRWKNNGTHEMIRP